MANGVRHFPRALKFARRPARRLKPWCERIALLIAVVLAYARVRAEIGNWQALLATAGAPLAVLDGPWSGRFVSYRVRRRLSRFVGVRARRIRDAEPAPITLRISGIPHGHDVVISARTGGPVAVSVPAVLPLALSSEAAAPAPVDGTVVPLPPIGRSQHCVLFAADIAQFTDARRDDEVQLALREALYRVLTESFEGSGINWRSCIHEDRGDGVIVVIPANMPTITVVDPLVDQIRARLRKHNRLSSPVAQVRLRLAAHIGEVYRDGRGLAGKAVNHLFRMLDAPTLRQVLQSSETDLALMVSDYLYQSVIHGGPGDVDPAAYSEVTVRVKQFQARAWLLDTNGAG